MPSAKADIERYHNRKKSGICYTTGCSNIQSENGFMCDQHHQKSSDSRKRRYEERRAKGLCPKCSKPMDVHGRSYCIKCRDRMNQLARKK